MKNKDFIYKNAEEEIFKYDNNTPISAIFDLLQKCPANSAYDLEDASDNLLKALDHYCGNALDEIHRVIKSLGDVLSIAIDNKDAGIDNYSVMDMGALFQMLGKLASDIFLFKSNAECVLRKRAIPN